MGVAMGFRAKKGSSVKILTPIKAIRKNCIDCSGNQKPEVRNCVVKDCSLYPYRMGRRPKEVK